MFEASFTGSVIGQIAGFALPVSDFVIAVLTIQAAHRRVEVDRLLLKLVKHIQVT